MFMIQFVMINFCIIEGFYVEVLVFVDEVCVVFRLLGWFEVVGCEEDFVWIVFFCEVLCMMMWMMYVIVWLFNYCVYFMGEFSEFQLCCYGKLVQDSVVVDFEWLVLFDFEICDLIGVSECFYVWLMWFDNGWCQIEVFMFSVIVVLCE